MKDQIRKLLNEAEQARLMEFLEGSALLCGKPLDDEFIRRSIDVIAKGIKRRPITFQDLEKCADTKKVNLIDQRHVEAFLESMETILINANDEMDDLYIVELIADHFQKFMASRSFGEDTLFLGLLLVNYMGAVCRLPFFVFRAKEKERLLNALQDPASLSSFFVEKRREAYYGHGRKLMLAESSDPFNTTYKDSKGNKLIVHWNSAS